MTLEQLRVFVAVAEREHVTQAARALNLAQSAASAAIAALEGQYQTALFDRVGRGVTLTQAGRVFLVEARAVLARAAAAELALAGLGALTQGTLVVQASQTIVSYWLPHHLVAFQQAHRGIEIRLSVGNTAQVARAVHDGEAELGFVEGVVADPALIGRVVAHDRLMLLVAPDHPWAGRNVTGPEMAAGDWVLREPGSGTRSEFEAALAGFGVAPSTLRVLMELPSNEAVRAAVEAGAGATALSASVAAPSLEAGLLSRVGPDLPERAFQVLHHRERHLSRAAEALLSRFHQRVGRGGSTV
jgi:DNA-binding transcriptional LysR family regulator